jgi:hypothetical protein
VFYTWCILGLGWYFDAPVHRDIFSDDWCIHLDIDTANFPRIIQMKYFFYTVKSFLKKSNHYYFVLYHIIDNLFCWQGYNSAMLFSWKPWYECSVFIIKFEVLDAFVLYLPSLKVSRCVSYHVYGIVICTGSAKGSKYCPNPSVYIYIGKAFSFFSLYRYLFIKIQTPVHC